MGFWDFLRAKEEKPALEKIKAEDLEAWFLNKQASLKNDKEIFFKLIQKKISDLASELEEKRLILGKINVAERKAEEKIKIIVKENLDNYIIYLDKLIEKLKEMIADKDIVGKINSIFKDFSKKSSMSFEKATFLIGKELGDIRDSIKKFFSDLERMLKENEPLNKRIKAFDSIQSKIDEISNFKKIHTDNQNTISNCDNKLNELSVRLEKKEKEFEEFRNSEEFTAEEKKKETLRSLELELEKEISSLRRLVDFKALANFFHSFPKEMEVIKKYKENFKDSFLKNNGEDLIKMLDESKLKTSEIEIQMKKVSDDKNAVKGIQIGKTKADAFREELAEIKEERASAALEKSEMQKKDKRTEANYSAAFGEVRQELFKINVELAK